MLVVITMYRVRSPKNTDSMKKKTTTYTFSIIAIDKREITFNVSTENATRVTAKFPPRLVSIYDTLSHKSKTFTPGWLESNNQSSVNDFQFYNIIFTGSLVIYKKRIFNNCLECSRNFCTLIFFFIFDETKLVHVKLIMYRLYCATHIHDL